MEKKTRLWTLCVAALVAILYLTLPPGLNAASEEDGQQALQHLNLSRKYSAEGNNLDALSELCRTLKLAEAAGDSTTLAIVYNNMGNIYIHYKDFERSTALIEKAYAIGRHHLTPEQLFQVVQNLVGNNIYEGNLPKAKEWYGVLEHIRPKSRESQTLYSYCVRLLRGMIQDAEGRHREAIATLAEAEQFAAHSGMGIYFQCGAVEELHKAYRAAGMVDSAQTTLARFYDLSTRLGLTHKRIDALKQLTLAADQAGNHAEGLRYKALRLSLQDSLMNQREYNRLAAMQTQFDSDRREQRIAAQRSRIEAQTRWLVWGSVALIILCTLLGYIAMQKRRVTQAYRHLFDLNRQIAAQPTATDKPATKRANSPDDDQRRGLVNGINEVMSDPDKFCAPDFSLQRLAELVGSNTKYVSRTINQEFGVNFNSYVNTHRINEARLRLADSQHYGNQTIQAISDSLGFGSVSTFNAAFKRLTGMSPSLYQKMANKNADALPDS